MRVIAIVATYNERRFIASLIEHLFQQGVEVYLMDNCSTDDTVAIASQYLHKGLVGIETLPRQGYFSLTDQLKRKEQLAASLDADWIMHVDADELHYPSSRYATLADAFAEVEKQGFNAVNFMEYTFVPTHEHPFHDHPQFVDTMRWYYPFAPFLPHRLNAWKKQIEPVDLVSSGGHVVAFAGLKQYPESFIMKHYLILSKAHVEEKYCALEFGAEDKEKGWGYPRVHMTVDMVQFPPEAELFVLNSDGELNATSPRKRHFWADEYDRRMKARTVSHEQTHSQMQTDSRGQTKVPGQADAPEQTVAHKQTVSHQRTNRINSIIENSKNLWHKFVKPKLFIAPDQRRQTEKKESLFVSYSLSPPHTVTTDMIRTHAMTTDTVTTETATDTVTTDTVTDTVTTDTVRTDAAQTESQKKKKKKSAPPSIPLSILLILSANPYPPQAGIFMRWWAIIRYLGQRHNLTLVMFSRPLDDEPLVQLLKYCTKIYAVEHGGTQPESAARLPFKVRRHYTVKMRDTIEEIARESFDVAILEQIFLAPYRTLIKAPIILGEHNVESSLLAQTAGGASFYGQVPPGFENATNELQLLSQYEDEVWPEFSWRTAVSEADRSTIQQRAKRGETWLVENGIDSDLSLKDPRPDTKNVLFTGLLAYYPNVDAVLYFWKEIWPHVLELSPTAQLVVAGRSPSADLVNLAHEHGFKLVADPDDMRSVAADCSVSICPLRLGSGTRLKILEAMAWGLPVVSTSLGCEGLAVENEQQLLIRDNPKDFAVAVHHLLSDLELWKNISQSGRKLVTERYGWNTVLEPLNQLCKKVANKD